MSAPSAPPDNSLAVEQSRQQAAERQREIERQEAAQRKAELAALRQQSASAGRQSAADYFTTQGLDPSQYSSAIDARINSILNTIAPDDPNPGSYFNNVGQTIWDAETNAGRSRAQRELDSLFPTNFDSQRIPFTLDDPYLSAIEQEQYADADSIIQNMLSRGVITNTGYQAAKNNLDSQLPGVRSRLNEIGTTTLAGGQQTLRDIANQGRSAASTLNLGQTFDPYSYGSQADQSFSDFVNQLSDTIRAKIPGKLFTTSGLSAIAGSGSGAQNTMFDPEALAGILPKSDDDDNTQNVKTPSKDSIF